MSALKIVTFTPVWKRPEVFEICLKGLKRLKEYDPERFDITPFFIVSESIAAKMVMDYGFDFIYSQNQPLGAKKNVGLDYVYDNYDFNYIMEIGSDDLITNDFLDFIEPWFKDRVPQITPFDVWFVDSATGKTAYWTTEMVLGLGRSISKGAIAKVKKRGLPMWQPEGKRGMDTFSWRTLAKVGITNTLIKPEKIYTLDIKSEVNINDITPFTPHEMTYQELLSHFPEGDDVIKLIEKE